MKKDKYQSIPDDFTLRMMRNGERVDKRQFDEIRETKVETDFIENAEGSAKITLGNTVVIVGVKIGLGTPFPDNPADGILISNADMSPISSPRFEPGPPRENVIELARVIDRGIRESHMMDTKKLCIEEGEKVWMVNVDTIVMNHDGNLIDAAALGASAALSTAKMPELKDGKVVWGTKTKEGLPITCKPIAVTSVKIGNKIITDPSLKEEDSASAGLTVTTMDNGNLCAMQKSGGALTVDEIQAMIDISSKRGKELRKLI